MAAAAYTYDKLPAAEQQALAQSWEREISAVAASSMRLWMATAPLPRSQDSM
jgi:hypothetical protein